jgi:hypothetical protein
MRPVYVCVCVYMSPSCRAKLSSLNLFTLVKGTLCNFRFEFGPHLSVFLANTG